MDTKDIIKKYWFVALVGILLVVFIIFYCVDLNKNKEVKVDTLVKDGQTVIYSIDNDTYYFADDLYEDLALDLKANAELNSFILNVCREGVETTSDMSNYAASYAQYVLQSNDKTTIDKQLRQYGYEGSDDLSTYCIDMLKQQEVIKEYLYNNYETVVEPKLAELNPRKISHILIKVADVEEVTNEDGTVTHVAHPTDEEQAKLDAVLKALEDKDFAEVAKEYSEDGSASSGGSLGYFDKSSSEKYVAEFYNGAVNLKEGQVSEPVVSQYGYHIIRCDASEPKSLLDNDSFIANLTNAYSARYTVALYEKGEELGITIEDETLKTAINNVLESARNEIAKENEEEAK